MEPAIVHPGALLEATAIGPLETPEPAGLALVGLGMLGIAFARRRA